MQLRRRSPTFYVDLLPLLNSGRIELLDHPRLVAQLCGLERRPYSRNETLSALSTALDPIASKQKRIFRA